VELREARPDDAGGIAAVHVRAWQAGYRDVLPDRLLDGLSVSARAEEWRGRLGPAAGRSTFVAVDGGRIVGFCTVAADGGDGEVAALYVDPDRWHAGTGSALLERGLASLRASACQAVTLWVFAGNDPALAFYARYGFAPDGAEAAHDWADGAPAIRLRLGEGGGRRLGVAGGRPAV
jgi:ribosomal protein S18 acetylase RimI-like enzyme